jgi:5-methylcytosine-specific restriction endonuclease McrA
VRSAGYCDEHRKEAHREYNARRTERADDVDLLYRTAAWRRLRRQVLQAEPLCRICKRDEGRAVPAVVVDHIVPVKQGGSFWEIGNLQPLCNRCHEAKSHAEGSRFFPVRRGARVKTAQDYVREAAAAATSPGESRPAWLPRPTVPVHVVCGPPGCGKSTLVGGRASAGDLVLDLDVMASALSGLPLYHADLDVMKRALHMRNHLLGLLGRPRPPWPEAWLIVTAGKPQTRTFWRGLYGDLLEMPFERDVCIARVRADNRRPSDSLEAVERAILDWH